MKKVFLGGANNDSKWRDKLIPMLKIDYFNPMTDQEQFLLRSKRNREDYIDLTGITGEDGCDFYLYVIVPGECGGLTIAAAAGAAISDADKTIVCVLAEDGDEKMEPRDAKLKRFVAKHKVEKRGGKVFESLEDVAEELNRHYAEIPLNVNVIECLIKRDGHTQMCLQKSRYMFEKNENGDYVCEVLQADHRKHLLSLPDFRIYQEHLLPKPEFTKKERDFMAEWRRLGAENFTAYVNGRLERFNESCPKIRAMAIAKWNALAPLLRSGRKQQENVQYQACPILGVEETIEEESKQPDEPVTEEGFIKEWLLLKGPKFKEYVEKNEQRFLDSSDECMDKAEAKWKKLIPDEPFHFEIGDEE